MSNDTSEKTSLEIFTDWKRNGIDAVEIVNGIRRMMYVDENGNWNEDQEISGADFVADVCSLFAEHGLNVE